MPNQHKIIINATSDPCQFRILNFNWSIFKKIKNRIKNKKYMNLDLTSSSSRTQPRKNHTNPENQTQRT